MLPFFFFNVSYPPGSRTPGTQLRLLASRKATSNSHSTRLFPHVLTFCCLFSLLLQLFPSAFFQPPQPPPPGPIPAPAPVPPRAPAPDPVSLQAPAPPATNNSALPVSMDRAATSHRLLLYQMTSPTGKLPRLCYVARHNSGPNYSSACTIFGLIGFAVLSNIRRLAAVHSSRSNGAGPKFSEPKTRVLSRLAAVSNQLQTQSQLQFQTSPKSKPRPSCRVAPRPPCSPSCHSIQLFHP